MFWVTMMIKVTFPIFIIFLLISPAMHSAISEEIYKEKIEGKTDAKDTEKLVDHIVGFVYSEPIPIQVIDFLQWYCFGYSYFGGLVRFGKVKICDIIDENPITVHVNLSVIWQDNHTIFPIDSYKCKLSKYLGDYDFPASILFGEFHEKLKTPTGRYTLRIELYVEEDSSSKVVEIPGVMFYYICMLSTGPSLLTCLKIVLSYIPWANEHLHDFIYSDVWDP